MRYNIHLISTIYILYDRLYSLLYYFIQYINIYCDDSSYHISKLLTYFESLNFSLELLDAKDNKIIN